MNRNIQFAVAFSFVYYKYIETHNGVTLMERLYNVMRVVENPSMANYGKRIQLNATPMTHHEACTFLSKMTKYKWCRDFLVESV